MKLDIKSGKTEIIGIISMGIGCTSIVPDVHTRVSRYVPWINRNLETFVDTETPFYFSTAFTVTISLLVVATFLISVLNYLLYKKK